ncbi:hypothetical protein ACA910_009418 [Epithemia clementina (nom. ined.)]
MVCEFLSFAKEISYFGDQLDSGNAIVLEKAQRQPVEIIIFDGSCRPPRATSEFWTEAVSSTLLVLSGRTLRGPCPQGWTEESRAMSNANIGRVTTWNNHIHVLYKTVNTVDHAGHAVTKFFDYEVPALEKTHLTDLIDRTRSGRRVTKRNTFSETPEQVDFASVVDFSTEFALPTVFGSTLCMRTLSPNEVMLCLDIPAAMSRTWNDDMKRAVSRALTSPIKVADTLGQQIRRFVLRASSASPPGLLKHTACISLERANKRGRYSEGSVSFSQEGVGTLTAITWAQSTRMRFATFSLSNYDLESTAAEKAVKSDNAEVLMHLWNFRVAYLLGVDQLSQPQMNGVEVLRAAILRLWKRNILQSWSKWWKANYQNIRKYQPNNT